MEVKQGFVESRKVDDVIWKQMALYQNRELFPNAKSEGLNSQSKCSLTNQTMEELELFSLSPDSWSGLEQETNEDSIVVSL